MTLQTNPLASDGHNARDFELFPEGDGVLRDMRDDDHPTRLACWNASTLDLPENATSFGFVYSGEVILPSASGDLKIGPGSYFSIVGAASIRGSGRGIVVSRYGHRGFFQIGGPIEEVGRLCYIDGCTDSLLLAPILKGDPCLNLLHFPRGIDQTPHTHPSMRVGMIAKGAGVCVTHDRRIPLGPGDLFIIPAETLHSFATETSTMTVIAYHPDSDFGPTHEFHPMINRTMVDGVSASQLDTIRTREADALSSLGQGRLPDPRPANPM